MLLYFSSVSDVVRTCSGCGVGNPIYPAVLVNIYTVMAFQFSQHKDVHCPELVLVWKGHEIL